MLTRKIVKGGIQLALAVAIAAVGHSGPAAPAVRDKEHEIHGAELRRVLARLMAPPEIHAEPGFAARLLVLPGETYDPLFMRDHGDEVWVNDDGGQEGNAGSQILAVDHRGHVRKVVEVGRLLPVTGFDFAPAGFGPWRGQIFSLAQPAVGTWGLIRNHVIQRVDPAGSDKGVVFCTLPSVGTQSLGGALPGTPAYGIDARFGPEGSPFAGRFFADTMMNGTIYQVTADGKCTPFVSFDRQAWGSPQGLTFSRDGAHMIVANNNDEGSVIARVRPDGAIEPQPLLRVGGLWVTGMDYAPPGFGVWGGQLFMAALKVDKALIEGAKSGDLQDEQTHPPRSIGGVYRLTGTGELKLVASGFRSPQAVHFVGDKLWVSDVNGDFIAGHRELPDGFIVELTARHPQ